MTRSTSLVFGAVALSALGFSVASCDAILGIEELHSNPRRDDPEPVQCEIPTDCPAAGNSCFLRSCEGGVCKVSEAPAGTEVLSQVDGDCSIVLCNAAGEAEPSPDPDDVAPDGSECTSDVCTANGAENPPVGEGTPCSTGVCDGAGSCVQCTQNGHCTGGDICQEKQCVPATCGDNIPTPPETGTDCGGPVCPPCGAGQPCVVPGDCKSGVCGTLICQPPSCEDTVKNGGETDTDCGGPECPACDDLKHCMMASDCESFVCSCEGMNCDPICQVPTCTDGVQNGAEVDSDCQGGCVGTCDEGEPCTEHSDCGSNFCNALNVCAPPG
ncbi:MAG: hypothetical protein HOV80_01615 [Polyangiaceae bacterium]|nr:hypothetical protein [Polyangiaceae bacterium]